MPVYNEDTTKEQLENHKGICATSAKPMQKIGNPLPMLCGSAAVI